MATNYEPNPREGVPEPSLDLGGGGTGQVFSSDSTDAPTDPTAAAVRYDSVGNLYHWNIGSQAWV